MVLETGSMRYPAGPAIISLFPVWNVYVCVIGEGGDGSKRTNCLKPKWAGEEGFHDWQVREMAVKPNTATGIQKLLPFG